MEQRRQRALEALKFEHVLRDREALDSVVRGVRLTTREIDTEEIAEFLSKIQDHLPDVIRDESTIREDDDGKITLLLPGGSLIGALPMQGGGENWMVAVIATTVFDGGEAELDREAVDAVNSRMPGMLFVATDSYAAFINGSATPSAKVDAAWREICVRLAIENHARARRFAAEFTGSEDDEVTRYWRAERSIADDLDPVDANLRLLRSFKNYVKRTPEQVRPLVRLRERSDALQLEVPYYRRAGSQRIVVRGRYMDGNTGLAWAPAGMHYFAEVPEDITYQEALARVDHLNGMGPESAENDMHTTPWLLGTWQTAPGENGSRLLYHGYVPTTLVDLVDLDEVVSGIVAEVFTSRRKLDVTEELKSLAEGVGGDVQEA